MIARSVGSRGMLLTFDDGISVYLIHGSRVTVLCDTHLGPDSMAAIQPYLNRNRRSNPLMIFNSHADWDHIWGNCAFPDSFIIAHEACRTRMEDRGIFDLNENRAQVRGDVVLRFPDLTFRDHLTLADEGIVFSAAPGHTVDSAICYDQRDKVLYLGDLVEEPIPYLDAADLNQYLKTLQGLWDHEAETLVSAHSGIISRDLIPKNMGYIRNIQDGVSIDSSFFGAYAPVHQWNRNMRIIHDFLSSTPSSIRYEKSLVPVLAQVGDLHTRTREELLVLLSRIFG